MVAEDNDLNLLNSGKYKANAARGAIDEGVRGHPEIRVSELGLSGGHVFDLDNHN